MKKILLGLLLTLGLMAQDSPYIGAALSASTADDGLVSCRASSTLLGGVKLLDGNGDFAFSIEGRAMNSFNGSYTSSEAYLKPEYKGFYSLIGYGSTTYTDSDLEFKGARYGLGIDMGLDWKHLFADIVYKEDEKDWVATVGFIYIFEGF